MQENEPQKLVEKVAGDIESLLDRKVQALKVGAIVCVEGEPGRLVCTASAMSQPTRKARPSWPSEFRLDHHWQGCAPVDCGQLWQEQDGCSWSRQHEG